MRFSLTRGNVNHLLLSGIIYILAVFVIPLQLPRNISVDNRVTIVLFLSLTAMSMKSKTRTNISYLYSWLYSQKRN